jgi:hypothetical protein
MKLGFFLAAVLGGLGSVASLQAQGALPSSGCLIVGKIDSLQIDNPADKWSGGSIVVAGQHVILPRNLLLDLPANRLTLQELFEQAPAISVAAGETGLAADELSSYGGGFATVLANRTAHGNVIAGEVHIDKGQELLTGVVTYIDYDDGYFRINGATGSPNTGVMIRINDPFGRHTIQKGPGVDPANGPNGSPDVRFGLDPDNYTISFTTGYPMAIPSTTPVGQRSGYQLEPGDDPNAASDADGNGDPFAPQNNRGGATAADSRRFAPLQLGDSIQCEGNWEDIAGVRFVSTHTLCVFDSIATRSTPDQPDYMTFDEVEWEAPGFLNQRAIALLIGFTTLSTSQLDIYKVFIDPVTGEEHEYICASTVNNPRTINQGVVTNGGIFKIKYDLNFNGGQDPRNMPGTILSNAGFASAFPFGPASPEDNFAIMSPISREVIARTRHKLILNPGVISRDINGNEATNGGYLTPVGIVYPEFVEIDLDALTTPYNFEGIPWLLDRRLCQGGWDNAGSAQRLDPFPVSGLDPAGQTALPFNARQRIPAYYPFGQGDLLDMFPPEPGAFPIEPARLARATSLPPVFVSAATYERGIRGNGNANYFVQAAPGHLVHLSTPGGIARLMQEQAPGRYYARMPFSLTQFSTDFTVMDLTDLSLAPVTGTINDVVNIKAAVFSDATAMLTVMALSSDTTGAAQLDVFGDDGSHLGTLSRGRLSAQVQAVPSSITVRSSLGGSSTIETNIIGRRR